MKCSTCDKAMKNLGNISGVVMTSNPPQWTEVYVCDECKIKIAVPVSGKVQPSYGYLNGYAEKQPPPANLDARDN
jgi:uncharacterized protein YlaI